MTVTRLPNPLPVQPQVPGVPTKGGQRQTGTGLAPVDGPDGQRDALLRISARFAAMLDSTPGVDEPDTVETVDEPPVPRGLESALEILRDVEQRAPGVGLAIARQALMRVAGDVGAEVLVVDSPADNTDHGGARSVSAQPDEESLAVSNGLGPAGAQALADAALRDHAALPVMPAEAADARRTDPADRYATGNVRATGAVGRMAGAAADLSGPDEDTGPAGQTRANASALAPSKTVVPVIRAAVAVSDEVIPVRASGRDGGDAIANIAGVAGDGTRGTGALPDSITRRPAGADVSVVRSESAREGAPGGSEVRRIVIRLEPVHLGKVTALLSRKADGLEIRLMPEQATASEALKMDSAALSRILRAAGVSSEAVAVQVIEPERPAGAQTGTAQGQTTGGGSASPGGQSDASGSGAAADHQSRSGGGRAERSGAKQTDTSHHDDTTNETGRSAAGGAVYI